jgi:hypothetical protein
LGAPTSVATVKPRLHCSMKSISCGLSFLLFFQYSAPAANAQTPPAALNIVVLEGEGATNNARQRIVREPVVRIEDENHNPIAGAAVVFTLPTEGATGVFSNGAKTLTVITDNNGRAFGKGLRVNQVTGKLPIHVTASYRGLGARTIINEINQGVPGAKESAGGGGGKLVAILLIAGAAAGGGAYYYATHNNASSPTSSSTPAPAVSIGLTVGTGVIIGPH